MGIYVGGALGALLRLTCPHCHEVQARARKPRGSVYACRRCHKRFSREDGERADKKRTKR